MKSKSLMPEERVPFRAHRALWGALALLAATQCALPAYRHAEDDGAGGEAGGDGSGGENGLGGGTGGGASGGGTATGGAMPGDDCAEEDAFECVAQASRNRFVCEGGQLVAGESCASNELCDTQSGTGACKPVLEDCLGRNGGEPFCDGTVRKVCGPDLVSVSSVTCDSEDLCTQSTTNGCAVCLDGDVECPSASLLRTCKEDNTGFDEEACPDDNCSLTAKTCTDDYCREGQGHCEDNELSICNEDRTAFGTPVDCGSGICDEVNAQCDVCDPDSVPTCNSEGDTAITCAEDGQMELTEDCEGPAPHCRAATGTCEGCTDDEHCDPNNECLVGTCDTVNTFTCEVDDAPADTRCTIISTDDGYCDDGDCVECRDNDDCVGTGATTLCRDDVCVDPLHSLGWEYANPGGMATLGVVGNATPGLGTIYWFLLPTVAYDATVKGFGIHGASAGITAKVALYQGTATQPTVAVAAANPNLGLINGTTEQNADPSNITLQAGSRYWVSLRFSGSGTVRGQSPTSGVGWIDAADYSPTTWPSFNAASASDNNGIEWGVYINVEDVE